MAALGGGGSPCAVCEKTVYPAETIQFEKLPYHAECLRCTTCDKKLENASKCSKFEDSIYCKPCFAKGGFAQKQRNVKWTKKEGTSENATASKFGGGGFKCTSCNKTSYPAETIQFDKKPYHSGCFRCSTCSKQLTAATGSAYDDAIYCKMCFAKGGFAAKQREVKWTKKEPVEGEPTASKFGGGGTKCHVCAKTVYAAETLSYDKKPYHPACFKCHDCDAKLSSAAAAGGAYEGNAICKKCWKDNNYTAKQREVTHTVKSGSTATDSRFAKFGGGGQKCYQCQKTVFPAEAIAYEKHQYHADCFKCKNCGAKQSVGKAQHKNTGDDVDVYCGKCWTELGLGRADA